MPQNKKDKYSALGLVMVSAMALSSFPALAQTVNLSCTGAVRFGEHVACSAGTLRINPDGTINTSGCLITSEAPIAPACKVSVTGGTATKNVKMYFDAATYVVSGSGDSVNINALRMQERGEIFIKTSLVFTPLEMTTAVTVDIGGTITFDGGQTQGSYTGGINVKADFI